MRDDDEQRAADAAVALARGLGLDVDGATVVNSSNKLALRLLPCDVFARVAPVEHQHAAFEVGLAERFAAAGCPVASLEPRVEPRGYREDGFEVTFWTYHAPVSPAVAPGAYADGLARLHAGMRTIDTATPHFTDRVTSAEELVASRDRSPDLAEADRQLIAATLRRLRRAVRDRGASEQLLHGEPHPGNVLATAQGPLFVDLETCCRGPVAFDLAHVPRAVSDQYPGVDDVLLGECRGLVLAMVAAWRSDPDDRLPDGMRFRRELLRALRAGPPWPTLAEVFPT